MATVYDLSDHPLLDPPARELKTKNEDRFIEQVALAVEYLGLQSLTFSNAEDVVRVKRALALQLNYQLKLTPEVFYKKQESSAASKQNTTYRDGISMVYPVALQLVQALIETSDFDEGWEMLTSVRRQVR